MSKAIITTGGKQYVVSEGDTLNVELLHTESKSVTFEPLLIIDGNKVSVGSPAVAGAKVSADVISDVRADKVTSIRYKAKKRVHKTRGHRQELTQIRITKIA